MQMENDFHHYFSAVLIFAFHVVVKVIDLFLCFEHFFSYFNGFNSFLWVIEKEAFFQQFLFNVFEGVSYPFSFDKQYVNDNKYSDEELIIHSIVSLLVG